MDFTLLPQPFEIGYWRFALLALPRSSAGLRRCFVITESRTGELSRKSFLREVDIPLEDQYRYGLRGHPVGTAIEGSFGDVPGRK
ncbi:hypothetical protein D3C80_1931910 [compost metagenome]